MRTSSYQDRDGADHTALNAGQLAQIRSFPTAFNFPPATKSREWKLNSLSPRLATRSLVSGLLPSVTTTFTTLTLGEKEEQKKKCHKNSSGHAKFDCRLSILSGADVLIRS